MNKRPSSLTPLPQAGEGSLLMGILNITPDSFSDGGRYYSPENAMAHASAMIDAGADIIDIGGVSTRPGAQPISVDEELSRVIPMIKALAEKHDTCIAVDTSEPLVMQAAVEVGASLINDIYALQKPGALEMARDLNVPVCLMHMQGAPQTMQSNPNYPEGIMQAISKFFSDRISACEAIGINCDNIILDPGIGFGKTTEHNLTILRELQHFLAFGCPILVGVSRKTFLGNILHKDVENRLIGSVIAASMALLNGASIVRMHDVSEMREAMTVIAAIRGCK